MSKCYRRRNRPRSKSDPYLLPHTKRFNRKLEMEHRPGTMNIFHMMHEKKEEKKEQTIIETRAHQDSVNFRYLFDDSDFEDDSFDVKYIVVVMLLFFFYNISVCCLQQYAISQYIDVINVM